MSSSRGTSSSRRRSHGSKGKRRASSGAEYDNILLVGDAGVGKSCILNSLYGEAVFASGLAPARVTTVTTVKEDNKTKRRYIDCPGLYDVRDPKGNAVQLEKAFKYPGRYYVLFVLTQEDGRLSHEHLITVKKTLEAFALRNDQIGFVINKVLDFQMDDVHAFLRDGYYTEIINKLAKRDLNPSWFHIIPRVPKRDIKAIPYEEAARLTIFIEEMVPERVEKVHDLVMDELEPLKVKLKTLEEAAHAAHLEQQKQIEALTKQVQEEREKRIQAEKAHAEKQNRAALDEMLGLLLAMQLSKPQAAPSPAGPALNVWGTTAPSPMASFPSSYDRDNSPPPRRRNYVCRGCNRTNPGHYAKSCPFAKKRK